MANDNSSQKFLISIMTSVLPIIQFCRTLEHWKMPFRNNFVVDTQQRWLKPGPINKSINDSHQYLISISINSRSSKNFVICRPVSVHQYR